MEKHTKRYATARARVTALLVVVLLLAGMPHAALAQSITPAGPEGRINDSALEFGVWWVEDYPPRGAGGSDLPATRPDALGLRDFLTSNCKFRIFTCLIQWSQSTPWIARFVYGNGNAWANDWRSSGSGGSENNYIDTVDLAYFAGHGSKSGIYFYESFASSTTLMSKSQVVGAWGDRDLDWIGLAACNVLDDPISNLQDWGNAMNGVRLIMGFKTVMNDVPHGAEFGRYIRDGYSFTQAWFKAADKLQSQNRVARVLAENQAYFNDKPAQHATNVGAPTWPKYFQTHTVGSEPARAVNLAQLGGEMPVLQVQPLDLEGGELDALIGNLQSAFALTITIPEEPGQTRAAALQAVLENGGILYSADGQLELDAVYGLFLHTDRDNLWAIDNDTAQMAAAGVPMKILTDEEVEQIANTFLSQNNLMPGDAQKYEIAQDTLSTMEEDVDAAGNVVVAITQETPLNHQVIYSRIISYTPAIAVAGASQDEVAFSVMGPGSKLKVYVDIQVPDGLSAAEMTAQGVLGGMGGYRKIIDIDTAVQAGALRTVPMLAPEIIEKLFHSDLEATVALDHIPLPPQELVGREIISITAAYWEGPMGFNQGELIPVYALEVSNTLVDAEGVTSTVPSAVNIPVAPEYMSPLARISTTVDLEENIVPGATLVFEALDAAKTLAELGLDPAPNDGFPLNFNLGTQGGLFTYDWYFDAVAPENKLEPKEGTGGRVLEIQAAPTRGVTIKEGVTGTQRIILVVTDTGNDNGNKTSQAVITLNAISPLLLPTIVSGE